MELRIQGSRSNFNSYPNPNPNPNLNPNSNPRFIFSSGTRHTYPILPNSTHDSMNDEAGYNPTTLLIGSPSQGTRNLIVGTGTMIEWLDWFTGPSSMRCFASLPVERASPVDALIASERLNSEIERESSNTPSRRQDHRLRKHRPL